MAQEASTTLLTLLLLVAAAWDLARRKVPNALGAALLSTGIGTQLLTGGPRATVLAVVAGLSVGALLATAWSARILGGADVKLGAAAAVCVGWSRLAVYLLATALAGGIASLCCYVANGPVARERARSSLAAVACGLVPAPPPRSGDTLTVPYAVAIAAGALAALLWRSS